MIEVIIGALLPIIIILALGFLAGAHHDFNRDQATVLNRMVMLYALPLSLFAGLVTTPLDELIKEEKLVLALFIGMVGFYFLVYFAAKYLFKFGKNMSALLALAITGPAVPFVGVSVLAQIFGPISTIPISLGSFYLNAIQTPITIILLSTGTKAIAGTSQPSGNSTSQPSGSSQKQSSPIFKSILSALKEPVVWAPLLALVIVLLKIKFPTVLINSFDLLGKATGGVALFSSGIVLYSYKVTLNKTIAFSVLIKNLIIPFAIWGIVLLLGYNATILKETVLTLSIPTGAIAIMLAIQYKEGEKEISSILFFSTVLSILTMGLFMWLLN